MARSCTVAADSTHLYWTEAGVGGSSTIGRANLDGTGADASFIPAPVDSAAGFGPPRGVAVDDLTDTELEGRASAVRTQGQRGKGIVVKVKVKAKERLTATATGRIKVNPTYKLKSKTVELATGETKRLKLKPTKAKAKTIATALKRGEKAKARLTVKLTDAAGNIETEKLRVSLKRG